MFFEQPYELQWLFILPVFILIYTFRFQVRKKRIKKWLGSQSTFLRSSISEKKRFFKVILRLCVLALLVLALARPQGLGEKMETQDRGVYMLLMADASQSMLAEDIKPNRLAFMKKELSRLIDLSSGDQLALLIFAHSAVLASPFTNDLSAVKSYLNDLSTDYLTNQGTNFERAFALSAEVFHKIKEQEKAQATKVIVIASDGEDHSKQTKKAIQNLVKQQNIRIFTLSFGTKEGGIIPVRDYKNQVREYKKNSQGKLIITRLKQEALKNFAQWGKGSYYHANYGGQAVERLWADINRLKKTNLKKTERINKKEYYQWFLILAFLLALLELILSERSYKKVEIKQ